MIALLATLAVFAAPLPSECRDAHVYIPDEAQVKGIVVEENHAKRADVRAVCQNPRGCALAVWPGTHNTPAEYVIWYSDEEAWTHEYCTAVFSLSYHVHTD